MGYAQATASPPPPPSASPTATPDASSDYPTPTPTPNRNRQTLPPIPPFKKKDGRTRNFEEQRKSDRDAIRKYIDAKLHSNKLQLTANAAQSEALILEWRDAALREREERLAPVPTLRRSYPGEYDDKQEERERTFILKHYERQIEGVGGGGWWEGEGEGRERGSG